MKIICIGRNYVDHAREMGSKTDSHPVFFLKPDSSLRTDRRPFFIPDFSDEIHYEVELVLRVSRLGKSIPLRYAHRYYDAITAGIDFTARDLQAKCKEKGLPWEISKAFDGAARIGTWVPLTEFENPAELNFWLMNGEKHLQKACTSDMIHDFDQIISYVSQFMTLKLGDLVFTGTPEGVGQVIKGDNLTGGIENHRLLYVPVR